MAACMVLIDAEGVLQVVALEAREGAGIEEIVGRLRPRGSDARLMADALRKLMKSRASRRSAAPSRLSAPASSA